MIALSIAEDLKLSLSKTTNIFPYGTVEILYASILFKKSSTEFTKESVFIPLPTTVTFNLYLSSIP